MLSLSLWCFRSQRTRLNHEGISNFNGENFYTVIKISRTLDTFSLTLFVASSLWCCSIVVNFSTQRMEACNCVCSAQMIMRALIALWKFFLSVHSKWADSRDSEIICELIMCRLPLCFYGLCQHRGSGWSNRGCANISASLMCIT